MGSGESTAPEEQGMPEMYYNGVSAFKEGRYTVSEIYFHKALLHHPGQSFWDSLRDAACGRHPTNGHSPSGQNARHEEAVEDTVIELPLGKELLVILDYLRLCANIIKTYLKNPKDELCRRIAVLYAGVLNVNAQLFAYCYRGWAHEHARELNGENCADVTPNASPVDDDACCGDATPRVHDVIVFAESDREYAAEAAENGGEETNFLAAAGKKKSALGHPPHRPRVFKIEWPTRTREHVTIADLQTFFQSLHAYIRYYWCAAVFNYVVMCVNYVDKTFLSNDRELDTNEKAKVARIYRNLMDLTRAVSFEMQSSTALCEDERMRRELMSVVPHSDVSSSFAIEDVDAPESSSDTLRNAFICGYQPNNQSGNQTFLGAAATFNPLHPVAINTNVRFPIKFSIDYASCLKSDLAVIQPPGEREVFRYTRWVMIQDPFMVAGYSAPLLRHVLPYYTPSAGVSSSSLVLLSKENGIDVVHPARLKKGDELVYMHLTAFEDSETNKLKKEGKAPGRSIYGNPQLDLNDPRLNCFLSFEECYLVSMPCLILYAQLFSRCGEKAKALEYKNYVLKAACVLYGEDSNELRFTRELCDMYVY